MLLTHLRHCNIQWKRFSNYFRVLATYARHGRSQQIYLARSQIISKLADLYLGSQSPAENGGLCDWHTDAKGNRYQIGDAFERPDWTHFWTLMNAVVTRCDTRTPPPSGSERIPFTDMDKKFILNQTLITKMLKNATTWITVEAIVGIVRHFAVDNKDFSNNIIMMIMSGIEQSTFTDMEPYFAIMEGLVTLEDKLQDYRVNTILSAFMNVIEISNNYWRETLLCLEELLVLACESPKVAEWLKERSKTGLKWILQWLEKNEELPTSYGSDTKMKAKKPPRQEDYYYHQNSNEYSTEPPGRLKRVRDKADCLTKIFEGESLSEAQRRQLSKNFSKKEKLPIDFQAINGKWVEAYITKVDPELDKVEVQYSRGKDKATLVLNMDSDRLAPSRSMYGKQRYHDETNDWRYGKQSTVR